MTVSLKGLKMMYFNLLFVMLQEGNNHHNRLSLRGQRCELDVSFRQTKVPGKKLFSWTIKSFSCFLEVEQHKGP